MNAIERAGRALFWAVFGAGALALSACAPPGAVPTDGGIVLPDVPVPRDTSPPDTGQPPAVVSLLVRDQDGPVTGASIAIDDADGQREVGITGAGGRAMIPGVAWGTGRITITAAADAHPIRSLAGFRRSELGARIDATGTITIDLRRYYRAVPASGNVTNPPDPARAVRLFLDVGGQLDVTGTTFAGSIERGLPFHVYAIDATFQTLTVDHYTYTPHAIVVAPHAALAGATTFDVDMSATAPMATLTTSMPAPDPSSPVYGGVPGVTVTSDESYGRARLGLASEMSRVSGGAQFDYTVTWLETLPVTRPVTYYYQQTTDLYANVLVDGAPAARPLGSGTTWPVPPTFAAPESMSTVGLHEPIMLTGVDRMLPVTLAVTTTDSTVWYLELPAGAAEATIPAPPPGTDTTFWTDLRVYASSCEAWPGHLIACRRSAGGDFFFATL